MSAAAPLGGRIFTRGFLALLAIGAVGMAIVAWRFLVGLGPTTGMNDGYPWGLWIAFDVVTGTAIACGGYAIALLVYIFNRGRFHPLVRPALLTTALGYTVAGFSVVIDIGRWWNVWKVPTFLGAWNLNSALLEVALCIMGYVFVSWIEVSSSLLEKWEREAKWPWLTRGARAVTPLLEKALPFVIALGLLLPTMHQSSLGTLMVISTRVHPLWHTQFLPLLFLISVLGMGFAGVIMEGAISGMAFRLKIEWDLARKLATSISVTFFLYLAIRLADLTARGFPGWGEPIAALFVIELLLFAIPAVLLLSDKWRRNRGALFASAVMALFAGALYRFDVYLVAFDPGNGWHYFPSIPEMLVTIGLVALEMAAYVFIIKRFPILRKEVRT